MATDRFTTFITLPWPPKELNPNFKRRKHWTQYQPQTKQYRHDCFWLTEKQLDRKIDVEGKLPLTIEFYPPDRRNRDDDGMIGAFKAGRDGMADAIGINDNLFKPSYVICDPVKGGKVIVRI